MSEPLALVDYDEVASTYDERFAGESPFVEPAAALHELALTIGTRRILDLGCGTGHSLTWAAGEAQRLVGLDLSDQMLRKAKALNARFELVQGSAPLLPFGDETFDLVFTHLAFHHFAEKPRVVAEAHRLLRPGGGFAILTDDPRQSSWYLYDYFEGALEIDLARCPAISELEDMLRSAGFTAVRSPLVQDLDIIEKGDQVLQSYFLRKDSTSTLILLPDDAYAAGLSRIRADIQAAAARNEAMRFHSHIGTFMVHGFKPPYPGHA